MSEMEDWTAAQFQDELAVQKQILDALEKAKTQALTNDELQLLAWASGVQHDFDKEIRK